MKGKRANITLETVDLDSRAVMESHLVAESKERFLELAANWWDGSVAHFQEFHATKEGPEGEANA